ncbi:hypothetical protein [Mucilaginibacter ginsenosidivorax]|uniref:Uncharacterized protein n=1 Tax=Mucilaginibacter ginsenosidivorax TaxID=862126 RepID=A0A5B8W3W8_9SPHI|nr:hypothetical protein [Mucilaginibacter ginsenosidivorax]QEC78760.1 hypothetical protein FSB76_23450 [Mucilaginibacter ginsenosidivorax]
MNKYEIYFPRTKYPKKFTEPEKDIVSSFLFYIPLFLVMSYLIGIIKMIVYYQYFNLDILSLIDISEAVNIALGNLLRSIFVVVILIISINLLKYPIKVYAEILAAMTFILNRYKKPNYNIIVGSSIVSLFLVSIFMFFEEWRNHKVFNRLDSLEMLEQLSICVSLFVAIFFNFLTINSYFSILKYKNLSTFVLAIIILSETALFSAIKNIQQSIESHNTGTSITILNPISKAEVLIKSDSCYFYIGKTKNYIIFYNDKTQITEIYPQSEVKKASLH